MKVRFAAIAKRELFEASLFYDRRVLGLGDRFLDEVERTLRLVARTPLAWPVKWGAEVRAIRLHRFPYALIYRVETDGLMIYAVAHAKRRPMYWRKRLPEPG